MMNRPKSLGEVEEARRRLAEMLDARGEWFVREGREGAVGRVRRGEWELRAAGGALVLSYWGEAGVRVWRVAAWARQGEGAVLEASRRMGAERATLILIPRASYAEAAAAVSEARRAECVRLGQSLCRATGAKLEQARLSAGARRGEPGRYARLLLRGARGRVAATGPVVPLEAEEADAFLSSALLWLARLEEKSGAKGKAHAKRPGELWLVARSKLCAAVGERVALLREGVRRTVSLFEVDEGGGVLTQTRVPELSELLDATAPRLLRPASESGSELVKNVVALAPEAIDSVRARRGETLRFRGLPFARVRSVAGREHLWFGAEGARGRRLLDADNRPDFLKLVAELFEHRRADAADRRHALYRAAPEAWLESMLRRDITRLDPGLRLAPLHAQFRAAHARAGARPVDLLALRRDGRLVVIELKVSEDASLALQGADYWRRVETHRRAGHVEGARLFGDAEISDAPPLVYLVAPLLRFHRQFQTLARLVRPEVAMYRFDLCEDWRAGVRVARRSLL